MSAASLTKGCSPTILSSLLGVKRVLETCKRKVAYEYIWRSSPNFNPKTVNDESTYIEIVFCSSSFFEKTYKSLTSCMSTSRALILKVVSVADNTIEVQIDKEDYSLADIVHKELLNVKHVRFAGVPPPHPLIKTLTIQVHTDATGDPSKALKEALDLSQAKVSELLNLAREIFPVAPVGEAKEHAELASEAAIASSPMPEPVEPSDEAQKSS